MCQHFFFSQFHRYHSSIQFRRPAKNFCQFVLFSVDSVNVHGLVVLGLEGLSAILTRVFATLDVAGLHVIRDRLEARARLIADRAVRLVRGRIELDELSDLRPIVGPVHEPVDLLLALLYQDFGLLLIVVVSILVASSSAEIFYKEFQNYCG